MSEKGDYTRFMKKEEVDIAVIVTEFLLKSSMLDDSELGKKYKEEFNLRAQMENTLLLLKNLKAALERINV